MVSLRLFLKIYLVYSPVVTLRAAVRSEFFSYLKLLVENGELSFFPMKSVELSFII